MAKIIYLLEADQDIQDIMRYILTEQGYKVRLTDCEDLALNIRSVKPSLILLDEWLTRTDPAFCELVKQEAIEKAVPVILTTTQPDAGQVAAKLGADDVLSKPFDLEDLVGKVDYWLTKMDNSG